MISDKQLQANRINAQKSTGPRTETGKSIASKNSITHGLCSVQPVIEGEDPAEYNDFRNDMIAQFAPVGPMERLLVDRIVHAAWRLRRIGTIEVEIYDFLRHPPDDTPNKSAANRSARAPQVERSEIRQRRALRIPHISKNLATPAPFRFTTFAEAKAAWDESEEGILAAQNRWPTDPDYPSPSELFTNFIKSPKQPEPLDNPEILSDAIDRARAKTDSIKDHARLDQLAEMQQDTITQTAPPSLPLGQAVVNDMQNNSLLTRLSRYETGIERSMFKNLRQLQCMQLRRATRQATEPTDG